ncbi:DUF3039 domain-containing protein [Nocardia sp. FBN12]|uniref:DUF3039 domain-containing protein n=1 Tax=Nocardia sp. FBN12 TaxID=3419766 RepID=UPI003D07344E
MSWLSSEPAIVIAESLPNASRRSTEPAAMPSQSWPPSCNSGSDKMVRFEWSFSTVAEVGFARRRVVQLRAAANRGELLAPELGAVSHFVHSEHLAAAAVQGNATRALCGVFFVPMQDHQRLPTCPECSNRFAALPK